MARRNRKYLVSYKTKDEPPRNEEVTAADAACALGLVLDALEDDGEEPQFEWVMIRSAVKKAKVPLPVVGVVEARTLHSVDAHGLETLPTGVMEAYQQALAEEKAK